MRYVVFARDRRRKKTHLKIVLFLMAMLSIALGIFFALQAEQSTLPPTRVSFTFDEYRLEDEPTGQSMLDSVYHGEPDYVEIDINELDENEGQAEVVEDGSATSYDDELLAQDDAELVLSPVVALAEMSGELGEDVVIALAQGDLSLVAQNRGEANKGREQAAASDAELEASAREEKKRVARNYHYTVTRDDKLRDVLEQSGLGAAVAKGLENAFPQLKQLNVGQQFYWRVDAEGELESMRWLVSEKEEQVFERNSKKRFAMRKLVKQGEWKQDVVKGSISGSFVDSMKKVGLSSRQIQQLINGLQWQIATNKLKKGDKFAILVKREYLNGKVTELGNVEAIHVISGNKSYYAIQADNGRFYSRQGESLGKGFARYPFTFTPRVSSKFNPRRFHPVTRRIAPHRGVDFAVPSGTLIVAPADGVVEHIAYQAGGAGRYVKLRHGGQYTTVYMHLSKALVRVGQAVKKGDKIALSGNTGRSTGAHLHYEFHINGNAVDPMTVRLPGIGTGMQESERKAFLNRAKSVEAKLKL